MSDLPSSVLYFPLVGLVVGLFAGMVYTIGVQLWPPLLALVLSTAFTVWMTGAFHEDALADSFDGFGGGWNTPQILAIMKDSRVGSYALIGVVLVLAAKLSALTTIGTSPTLPYKGGLAVTQALVAGHVLGRWSSVPLIWRYPYVRPETADERPSAGRAFVDGVSFSRVIMTTTFAWGIVAVTLGARMTAPIVVALLVTTFAGRYFAKRLGGITGDALGAANQFVELAVYLTLAARHFGT